MASIPAQLLTLLLPLLLLFAHCSVADHNSPVFGPVPAPVSGGRASAPFKETSESLSPSPLSPLSDPSPDLAPHHSPSPPVSAPFPSPEEEPTSSTFSTPPFDLIEGGDESDDVQASVAEKEKSSVDSSGGKTGGKKAAVAIAAVAGVALVGVGALVYKKRQDNIRRARYGYATRRDLL